MSIEKALEILKYDVRLIEYHLNNGMLTKAELEKHMKEIPDSGNNVALGTTAESEEDDEEILDEEEAVVDSVSDIDSDSDGTSQPH